MFTPFIFLCFCIVTVILAYVFECFCVYKSLKNDDIIYYYSYVQERFVQTRVIVKDNQKYYLCVEYENLVRITMKSFLLGLVRDTNDVVD